MFWRTKKIERFLRKKQSLRVIARMLGRGISCISNEIKIGKVNGIYDAKKAEAKAVLRRRESKIQCLKVATDTNLKKFVIEGMLEDQSPEGISGRLKEVEKIFNMQAPKPYTNLWKVLMVDKLKNIFTIMQSRKEWSQEQKESKHRW